MVYQTDSARLDNSETRICKNIADRASGALHGVRAILRHGCRTPQTRPGKHPPGATSVPVLSTDWDDHRAVRKPRTPAPHSTAARPDLRRRSALRDNPKTMPKVHLLVDRDIRAEEALNDPTREPCGTCDAGSACRSHAVPTARNSWPDAAWIIPACTTVRLPRRTHGSRHPWFRHPFGRGGHPSEPGEVTRRRASRRMAECRKPHDLCDTEVVGFCSPTRQVGLEPTTYGLEGRCSIQLSYWRRSQPVLNIAGKAPGRFARSRGDRIRTCDPLVPNQVRYRAAPLPVRLAAKLCIAAAMVNPAARAQKLARSDSAAVRTARPRWLISFFRSAASSPKVHPSEGMKKSGS